MRLHYRCRDASGYFHTLRAAVRNPEEDGKGRRIPCGGNALSQQLCGVALCPQEHGERISVDFVVGAGDTMV